MPARLGLKCLMRPQSRPWPSTSIQAPSPSAHSGFSGVSWRIPPSSPLLLACRSGTVEGALRYGARPGLDGSWSGKFVLKDAEIPIEGIERPIKIGTALATMKGSSFQLRSIQAQAGRVAFQGDFSSAADATHPHHLRLRFTKLYTQDLEWLLGPTLQREAQGFIARTLRLRPPPTPDWLRQRMVEVSVRADELVAGTLRFAAAQGILHWRGPIAELAEIRSEVNEGSLTGRVTVDLRAAVPRYKAELSLKQLAWEGGSLDLDGSLSTAGVGAELLSNLRAQGSFAGHGISTSPANVWDSVIGSFEVTMARGLPILALDSVEVSQGEEIYSGTGRTAAAGQLELVLASESEQLGMTGSLIPLRLQPKSKSITR